MAEITPKIYADNIPVFCRYDKVIQTSKLNPNPSNPNRHTDAQIKMLLTVIKKNGWRQPITVSNQSGMIVKGHGRLAAAKIGKIKEVPVEYQDYASYESELADLMADNRISEFSEIDKKDLLNLFEQFDTGNIDFESCGYTEDEYEELAQFFDEKSEKTEKKDKKDITKCTKACCPLYGTDDCRGDANE